jgi:lipoprotein
MKKRLLLFIIIMLVSCETMHKELNTKYIAYRDFDNTSVMIKDVESISYSKQKGYYRVIYYDRQNEKCILYFSDNVMFKTNCKITEVVEF